MTQSIHSPTSVSGYLPYANSPQGSGHPRHRHFNPNERNPDAFSISSQRSGKSSSVNSLSLSQNGQSQHGLVRISSRPGSHRSSRSNLLRPSSRNSQRPNSQPMKVSRPPTPALINMALPAGAVLLAVLDLVPLRHSESCYLCLLRRSKDGVGVPLCMFLSFAHHFLSR